MVTLDWWLTIWTFRSTRGWVSLASRWWCGCSELGWGPGLSYPASSWSSGRTSSAHGPSFPCTHRPTIHSHSRTHLPRGPAPGSPAQYPACSRGRCILSTQYPACSRDCYILSIQYPACNRGYCILSTQYPACSRVTVSCQHNTQHAAGTAISCQYNTQHAIGVTVSCQHNTQHAVGVTVSCQHNTQHAVGSLYPVNTIPSMQ